MDICLFSLYDEEQKSKMPVKFEKHWGVFSFNGEARFSYNLGLGCKTLRNADDVLDLALALDHMELACSVADYIPLLMKHDACSCEFDGLGMITFLDPSIGDCRFAVGISDFPVYDFRIPWIG
ncbi:hypothetical protein AMTRI_Chr05g65250 [Amborella trichopoda]